MGGSRCAPHSELGSCLSRPCWSVAVAATPAEAAAGCDDGWRTRPGSVRRPRTARRRGTSRATGPTAYPPPRASSASRPLSAGPTRASRRPSARWPGSVTLERDSDRRDSFDVATLEGDVGELLRSGDHDRDGRASRAAMLTLRGAAVVDVAAGGACVVGGDAVADGRLACSPCAETLSSRIRQRPSTPLGGRSWPLHHRRDRLADAGRRRTRAPEIIGRFRQPRRGHRHGRPAC